MPLIAELMYDSNGLENSIQEPREEKFQLKLCSGSCQATQILQSLNVYRKSGIFTDVVLLIDGQEFPCHKATLSANSSYFRAMFSGNLRETNLKTVKIQNISSPTMSLLLDHMYGESIIIHQDNVEQILEASDLLQICRLRAACVDFLESQLQPCNCVGIMKFADSYSIPSLFEKSNKIILEGFEEVSCHEEFLDLSKDELVKCLSSQNLVVRKEEVVFEAVMRWVKKNISIRKKCLKEILEHVRLPLLDPVYFLEKVEKDKVIQECPECFSLLYEARMFYIVGNEGNSFRVRPRRFTEMSEVIIVVGGCDKKGLLKLPFTDSYHPKRKQWKSLASMPGYTNSEFAVCISKNNMYVSGGHMTSSDAWVFNTKLNVWAKIAPLNKGRWRHKMATLKGEVYAVGGFDGLQRLSSMERYSSFTNTWTPVTPMLEAVSSAAVVSCMNKLYVIGGALDAYMNTDKVQCFDPEESKWTYKTPTPFSQRCINAVELDNKIYVVGGLLSTIYSYCPLKDSWSEVASLPGPLESCGVTACDGKIFIMGGSNENGEGTDKALTFDPNTGEVEVEAPLQRCTSYHGCVTILERPGT
ncbi:kelch-like protein 35 [Bombina bombina]|uniref:kelch-like protein 35 n=1 Tax=Bombina bombina TaxID=8345 RepID=UPI00235A7BDD|nr:kelch-like protein 35 [Bombina bombina]